jgi:hypothetical protein
VSNNRSQANFAQSTTFASEAENQKVKRIRVKQSVPDKPLFSCVSRDIYNITGGKNPELTIFSEITRPTTAITRVNRSRTPALALHSKHPASSLHESIRTQSVIFKQADNSYFECLQSQASKNALNEMRDR